jgi:hypothetical protein
VNVDETKQYGVGVGNASFRSTHACRLCALQFNAEELNMKSIRGRDQQAKRLVGPLVETVLRPLNPKVPHYERSTLCMAETRCCCGVDVRDALAASPWASESAGWNLHLPYIQSTQRRSCACARGIRLIQANLAQEGREIHRLATSMDQCKWGMLS